MSAPVRTWLLRRLRAPRAGDPTRLQVLTAACCGLFTGLLVVGSAVAVRVGEGAGALTAAVFGLAVGGIPLARTVPGWGRRVRSALAVERRAFQQARITVAQQQRTQARWLVATTTAGALIALVVTSAAALTVVLAVSGTDLRLLLLAGAAAVLGAAAPGVAVWSSLRREIGSPDW